MHIYDVTIIGESGMSSDVPLPSPEAGMRAVNKDWDRHVLVAVANPAFDSAAARRIAESGKKLSRRATAKAAIAAKGNFGDLCQSVGIDVADYRLASRMLGTISAFEAVAWIQAGRPVFESRYIWADAGAANE